MLVAVHLLPFVVGVLIAVVAGPEARAEAPPPRPLKLMTYNLDFGNRNPGASLDAIAQADADVVLLQEITAEWRAALSKRFAAKYPHQAYRVHKRAAGGLAVLSKLPIRSEELWAPPLGTGAWFPAQRIVVDAPGAAPGGALQLLNVHLRPALEHGSWLRGFATTPPLRRKEIEAHWKRMNYALPTIVAGDFNEDVSGRALDYLARHGMTRVPTTGPKTWHYEAATGGPPIDLLALDLDHVMIDDHLVARDARVLDAGTSDHRPVVVTVAPR